MANSYTVYCHTSPSGKRYIGITKNAVTKRWKNGAGYDLCTAFARAIKKYGWDNIKHEIFETHLSKEEACSKEQEYIKKYKSNNPAYGYNLTGGGENYEPNAEWRKRASEAHKAYYKAHPEKRARISEQQRGRKASEGTRAKMSAARKKYIEEHPETREQCRSLFKGKKRSKENCEKLRIANQKKVVCIETGVVFNWVSEAAEHIGVVRTAVSQCLAGRSKTCRGLRFAYYNGEETNGNE